MPYYGSPPESSQLSNISAAVLAFYGETDTDLIRSLPTVTANIEAARVRFESKVYEGAGHAFLNDTSPSMFRSEAADSWARTFAFLKRSLAD